MFNFRGIFPSAQKFQSLEHYRYIFINFLRITRNVLNLIRYDIIQVVADPKGTHSDLLVDIPITIGDIPFYDEDRFAPPYVIQLTNDSDPPPQFSTVTHVPRMRCNIS